MWVLFGASAIGVGFLLVPNRFPIYLQLWVRGSTMADYCPCITYFPSLSIHPLTCGDRTDPGDPTNPLLLSVFFLTSEYSSFGDTGSMDTCGVFSRSMCTRSRLHITLLPSGLWKWTSSTKWCGYFVYLMLVSYYRYATLASRTKWSATACPHRPPRPCATPPFALGFDPAGKRYPTHAHSCWTSVEPPSVRSTTAGLWCSLTFLSQTGFRAPHSFSPKSPSSS